jgi:flagellar basal body-associated protein FliL
MKRRLKIVVPVLALLIVAGGIYKFVLSGDDAEKKAKPNVNGEVYILPKEFLLNLADDRFAKLSVALVLHHGALAEASGGGHGAPSPPEGFGPLPQEAVVRDVITDTITDAGAGELVERRARRAIKREIREQIEAQTDVEVEEVLFTDMAVQ